MSKEQISDPQRSDLQTQLDTPPEKQPETLSGWLSLLQSSHSTEIDMGLQRVDKVFQTLALDFSGSTVITVAGTNGKGSTCRFIEKLAQKLGYSAGVYSSPHIIDYKERVRINDRLLSDAQHCAAFEKVFAARGNTSLTYFESGTLAALQLLAEQQPDVIILEVGLGGRLDAVNIVEPDISVITTIGIDHQAWLGDSRELIAVEKAGIARVARPCIIGESDPPDTLAKALEQAGAKAIRAGKEFVIRLYKESWDFDCEPGKQKCSFANLPYGTLLTQNMATALATACYLGWDVNPQQLKEVIQEAALPGRYEVLSAHPRIILDVAHNQQATQVLAQRILCEQWRKLYIVVGMLSDKDSVASLAEFKNIDATWLVSPLDTPRSASVEVLNSALSFAGTIITCKSVSDAQKQLVALADEADLILVFGSFYTIAEFKQAVS